MATSPSLGNVSGSKMAELRRRLVFLVLALVVFRIGAHIPVPGIDRLMLEMQPASLNALAGDELSERDRLLLRASEVRTRLTALMDDDEHME